MAEHSTSEGGNRRLMDTIHRKLGFDPTYYLVDDFAECKAAFVELNESEDILCLPTNGAIKRSEPDLKVAATSWIHTGGAHHTAFSVEHLEDFARFAGLEFALIDHETTQRWVAQELRDNEVYYHLNRGLL